MAWPFSFSPSDDANELRDGDRVSIEFRHASRRHDDQRFDVGFLLDALLRKISGPEWLGPRRSFCIVGGDHILVLNRVRTFRAGVAPLGIDQPRPARLLFGVAKKCAAAPAGGTNSSGELGRLVFRPRAARTFC